MTDLGDVDGVLTGGGSETKLFDGVGNGESSAYTVLDAAAQTLELRAKGESAGLTTTQLPLEAGTVYDVIAIGRSDDGSLTLLVLSAPAEIRAANATPAAASPAAG